MYRILPQRALGAAPRIKRIAICAAKPNNISSKCDKQRPVGALTRNRRLTPVAYIKTFGFPGF
jgi:hypothetical protein